ncbi:MAG TPA: hypothetical protein VK509_07745 [Polyangiales bacterium]|nr:hypothetical protein [Polyangiales bacterium]
MGSRLATHPIGRSCGLLLASCALVLAAGSGASAQVALISRGPEDRAVLEQLAGMIDEPLHERAESQARGLGAIMDDARAGWPERYVVVIDRSGDSVYALRPADRTSVSRVLSPELLAESPYAVGLAIAELLEWLGATPRGGDAPTALPSAGANGASPSSAAPELPEPEPATSEQGASPQFGIAVAAGIELSGSPSAELSLARLALGLEAQLGRGRDPLWFALAARFSAPASLRRRLDAALRSAEVDALEYESTELALQLALGFGRHASTLALGPFVGLSPVRVAVLDEDGATRGEKEKWTGFAGLGVRLRHPIGLGFALDLSAEAELLFAPVRYRVTGRQVLEDGPLRAQTRLCLVWESAFSP